jgi:nucleoid-associated protein YgaU
MKMRVLGKLKSHLVCALTAGMVLSMQVSCGSSSDAEVEQEVGLEAATGTEGENGAPLNNSEEGVASENELLNEANSTESTESANAALNGGIDNFESAGGEAAPANETAEMINQSSGDASANLAADASAAAVAGSDPFAANSTEADPFAAPTGASNSSPAVATMNTSDTPLNAAPSSSPAEEVSLSTPSQGYVPEDGARMAYIIQVGDNMAGIARKIYGNSNGWRALAEENNISNPNLIYAGDVIYYSLNSKSRNFAQSYETSPRKSVTVKAGDSLSSIAAQVYGDQGSWRSLWKENPQVSNPDQLSVGMVLSYRATGGMASVELPPSDTQTQVSQVASMDLGLQE